MWPNAGQSEAAVDYSHPLLAPKDPKPVHKADK